MVKILIYKEDKVENTRSQNDQWRKPTRL